MRLSDVLGCTVVDADGNRLGRVHDVELVADGPEQGPMGPMLRVHHLVVGQGSIGARLGLDRDEMRGPLMLKWLFRRRRLLRIAWHDVERGPERSLVVRPTGPAA
jgi:sporulation protein YlmC with PRC-barrel domain